MTIQPAGIFAYIYNKSHHDTSYRPPTFRRELPKIGRNKPCPCGSGKKYKRCCLEKGGDNQCERSL